QRFRVHVEKHENDQQGERDHDLEALLGRLQILELACPRNVIAWRILNALAELLRRLANIAVDVVCGDVYKNEPDQFSVLTAHGGRTGLVTNISEQVDRHLRTGGRGDKHAFECVDVLTKIAGIARVDWVTLAPLNGSRNVFAADG